MADVNGEEVAKKSKKKNPGKKSKGEVIVNQGEDLKRKMGNGVPETDESRVKKRKKQKSKKEEEPAAQAPVRKVDVEFNEKDLADLLNRIEALLPIDDEMPFNRRAKTIDWSRVAFKGYSSNVCRDTWFMIQKKLRQTRILKEIVNDAKQWVNTEWKNNLKTKVHEDFPEEPITSGLMLFSAEAKAHVVRAMPGAEDVLYNGIVQMAYETLGSPKRKQYESLAADNKRKYEAAVEAFYNSHPDIKRKDPSAEKKPKKIHVVKPKTPFALFVTEQQKEQNGLDKSIVREECKDKWAAMDDKEKLHWINLALESENDVHEEVQTDRTKRRSILTKQELKIKDASDGKPEEPPQSGYRLFIRIVNKSNVLGKLSPQDKMRKIGSIWNGLSNEEKDNYKKEAAILKKNYNIKYKEYSRNLLAQGIPLKSPKKKVKGKDDSEHEADAVNTEHESMKWVDAVIPATWMAMGAYEKSMYLKYIQKIRNYFDDKYKSAETDHLNDEEDDASYVAEGVGVEDEWD